MLIGELIHRVRLNKKVPLTLKNHSDSMSRDIFDRAVENGEKLVILDDLVLDVTEFINVHPGGRFTIRHCIGRDISKFFFGGYSLDGNETNKATPGHSHSSYAYMIVNDIAIARFERDIPCSTQHVALLRKRCTKLGKDLKTVVVRGEEPNLSFR